MAKQRMALEEMSPEEQQAEIARRLRKAWGIVIESRNRRLREKTAQEASTSRAS